MSSERQKQETQNAPSSFKLFNICILTVVTTHTTIASETGRYQIAPMLHHRQRADEFGEILTENESKFVVCITKKKKKKNSS